MRIDKYLQVSRIIKRRAVAKEIVEKKRVTINDAVAKPSNQVRVGDLISIKFGDVMLQVEVKSVDDKTKKDQADEMYQILKKEKSDQNDG